MTYLSWIFMWFEVASGLRINMEKSSIIPVGRVENVESLAREGGCKVGELLRPIWVYLWVPITRWNPFRMVLRRDTERG